MGVELGTDIDRFEIPSTGPEEDNPLGVDALAFCLAFLSGSTRPKEGGAGDDVAGDGLEVDSFILSFLLLESGNGESVEEEGTGPTGGGGKERDRSGKWEDG